MVNKNWIPDYEMEESILGSTFQEKDLEVVVSPTLSFNWHIANSIEKLNQILEVMWMSYNDK